MSDYEKLSHSPNLKKDVEREKDRLREKLEGLEENLLTKVAIEALCSSRNLSLSEHEVKSLGLALFMEQETQNFT